MQVPQIDFKGIFERAAGHPATLQTRVIVVGSPQLPMVDEGKTLNGIPKPGSFAIIPARRREQLFV